MELADERLKEALAAGKIPITPEALTSLSEWVAKFAPATFLVAEWTRASKRRTDLKKELSELCNALQKTVRLLTRDDGRLAASLFNTASGDPGVKNERESREDGNRRVSSVSVSLYSADTGQRLIEQQRDLLNRAQASLKRHQAAKSRLGRPEHENTWFLHIVRILYGKLTGARDPAIAGPLHQFTKSFAELIGAAGIVPEDFDTFRGRFR